ncbi:gamma-glutamyl-gamma-aminobutyrate hydrolase family protein [Schumannella luteola]
MDERVSSARPVIGITTYLEPIRSGIWDLPAAYLPETYLRSVIDAGGIAVLLPPQPVDAEVAAATIASLDGLLVTGGYDVDPARYGQPAGAHTDAPRDDRDDWEDALLTAAIAAELPFLGICRGLQLLNVHQGGTLLQHLPDALDGDTRYSGDAGVFAINEAAPVDGSRIAGLYEGAASVDVRSYHHQAVDRLGDGLRVTAVSAGAGATEQVVQAIELEGDAFGVAVQWHPEQIGDLRVFRGLVDAAAEHRRARSARG